MNIFSKGATVKGNNFLPLSHTQDKVSAHSLVYESLLQGELLLKEIIFFHFHIHKTGSQPIPWYMNLFSKGATVKGNNFLHFHIHKIGSQPIPWYMNLFSKGATVKGNNFLQLSHTEGRVSAHSLVYESLLQGELLLKDTQYSSTFTYTK